MRELKLVQIIAVPGAVYGLDKEGVVWSRNFYVGSKWEKLDMEIKDKDQ